MESFLRTPLLLSLLLSFFNTSTSFLNGLEILKVNNLTAMITSKKNHLSVILEATIGGVIVITLILSCLVVTSIKKRRQIDTSSKSGGTTTISSSPRVDLALVISFPQIKMATGNFDENNLIGVGVFGKVYKVVLSSGVEVAVKRASPRFQRGFPEFQTEIEVLSQIRHRHLVSLIGYCDERSEMILVYEYMEKGPLRNYLYGNELPSLSWKQRLEICIGAAKGLHYLHTGFSQTIIHRNVKSTNILLGEGYLAKLSSFSLSKLALSPSSTHCSTAVKGTFGYLDPEYFMAQQLTDKSDVYSFGVTLLEVLCARPVIDQSLAREEINLAEWALMLLRRGQLEKIIDPRLVGQINKNSFRKFGEIAEKCLQEHWMDRPAIGDVLWNLEYCLQLQENEVRREPSEDSSTSEEHFPVIPFVRQIPSSSAAGRKLKNIVAFKKRDQKSTLDVKKSHLLWTPMTGGVNSIDNSSKSGGATTICPSPRVDLGLVISFAQIKMATGNFDEKNVIGVGVFGIVYKGVLSNGVKVAVKRASSRSHKGFPEFQTEIEVLSIIRHRHLVSLIGYCDERSEMILVYEYMEKGPLRNYLYGNELPSLSWKQRLEICIEAAKGLHYLHTGFSQTIIHRNVKSTNILLGEGYLAKLSSFGLSKLALSPSSTHCSTAVKGTFGYLDPEYFMAQKLTDKSDVYSFGVTLLEVLCARPVIDQSLAREEINLAEWALMLLRRGQLEKIIDPRLVGEINENSLRKFGEIAEKCLKEYGMDRPAIGDVLLNLDYCLLLQETEVRPKPYDDSGTSEAHFPVIPFVRRIRSSVVNHGTAAPSGDCSYDNNEGIKIDSSSSAAGRKLKHIVASIKKRHQKRTPDVKKSHLLWTPMTGGVNSIDNSTTTIVSSPRVDLGLLISLAQIKSATNNFDENNFIGEGGFGMVYKGILSNGVEVAVKRASSQSQQGFLEFQTEIEFLSQIRHRHLVSLIGYCDEGSEMILVYEYMEKGPLRNYLYGNELPSLSWKQRLEICIQAIKGLHYLHTGYSQTIIHRDIKSSNILLGEGYLAKLSDFGLSMLGPSIGETHVSTAVRGTFGYLDPEYFKCQKITDKCDVYSFGVMLLEMLCARPVIDQSLAREEINLIQWALMWLRRDQLEKIIDPRLVGEINQNSLKKFGEIAEKCLQEYGMDRPEIEDVLWNLEYCLHLHETEVRREPY